MNHILSNTKKPHNIERRLKDDRRIHEFETYVRGVRRVHVDVLRANNKDRKRGQEQYRGQEPRDPSMLLDRREKLRKKLAEEMRVFKLELSMKGLSFEAQL